MPRNEVTHHVFWPEYSSEVGCNKSCEAVLHIGAVVALLLSLHTVKDIHDQK